jgi:hypothetical protein
MNIGTVLVEQTTGLKLMVVEAATAELNPSDIAVNGHRCTEVQLASPRSFVGDVKLTTDPGMRG